MIVRIFFFLGMLLFFGRVMVSAQEDRKCGRKLFSILNDVCKGNFYGKNGCIGKRQAFDPHTFVMRKAARNVPQRTIVEKCCYSTCGFSVIQTYCC